MTRGRPLKFLTTESGCFVCVSHLRNQDGYVRLSFLGNMRMLHRSIWEELYGEIQDGFEVHHKCGIRSCCNPKHLELILKSEHATLTNRERYLDRTLSVVQDAGSMSVTDISQKYGISERTVYRHKRRLQYV